MVLVGCASTTPSSDSAGKMTKYKRIAIVCGPSGAADAQYVGEILAQAETTARTRLAFLEKVDFLSAVKIETGGPVPRPLIEDAAVHYDAVFCLVYSYSGGRIIMDICAIDTRTSELIWKETIESEDPDTRARLVRDGWWVPSLIKRRFYGLRMGYGSAE